MKPLRQKKVSLADGLINPKNKMMDQMVCPKSEKCPIFSGILKGTEYTEVYKRLYCEAGEAGRLRCKRYQVAQVLGKCPETILPNSPKSVEEIIAGINNPQGSN